MMCEYINPTMALAFAVLAGALAVLSFWRHAVDKSDARMLHVFGESPAAQQSSFDAPATDAQSTNAQSTSAQEGATTTREVLFVFAHPDDEAMFFTPVLTAMKRLQRHTTKPSTSSTSKAAETSTNSQPAIAFNLRFLCFSSGNYAGLGATRTRELEESAAYYGVDSVTVVEDRRTQDGPTPGWDLDFIQQRTAEEIARYGATDVFTFDQFGVSSHPNHIDVCHGVRGLQISTEKNATARVPATVTQSSTVESEITGSTSTSAGAVVPGTPPRFWYLRTAPFWRKYTFFVEDVLRAAGILGGGLPGGAELHVVSPISAWGSAFGGMRRHESQLVWFRYLFVAFSQYTYSTAFYTGVPDQN